MNLFTFQFVSRIQAQVYQLKHVLNRKPASAGFLLTDKYFMSTVPTAVSLRRHINYLQPQENIGCCTACATLLAAEITMASVGNVMNFSRLFLYYMTQKEHNRLGMKGAELRDALDTLMKYGAPPERYWPFTFSRANREPLQQAIEQANNYRLQSYEQVSPVNYKEYLNNGIPIIVGMRTGKLFWNLEGPLQEQEYKPINGRDNRLTRGHAITIIGYDDNINGGSWIIANSLGPRWGFQGYAAIPYICDVDIGESYIITNFAGISAGKKIPEI